MCDQPVNSTSRIQRSGWAQPGALLARGMSKKTNRRQVHDPPESTHDSQSAKIITCWRPIPTTRKTHRFEIPYVRSRKGRDEQNRELQTNLIPKQHLQNICSNTTKKNSRTTGQQPAVYPVWLQETQKHSPSDSLHTQNSGNGHEKQSTNALGPTRQGKNIRWSHKPRIIVSTRKNEHTRQIATSHKIIIQTNIQRRNWWHGVRMARATDRHQTSSPLSPYLFLIVMTTMFHDIHEGDKQHIVRHRVRGVRFDEVVYADATMCISENTRSMHLFLASIEEEGNKYGHKLNRTNETQHPLRRWRKT